VKNYLKLGRSFALAAFVLGSVESVQALPAFARRENVSCVMCHTNGSAAHLTEFGYIYRRMAFHWPGRLGDEKADLEAMNATKHMAIGVNVAYNYNDNTSSNGTTVNTKTVNTNGIQVPEVELWPLVGGFLGNWGVWSEFDSQSPTNAGASVVMSYADIRYAAGTPDSFWNFRGGMIAPEGYGASDQWIVDGNAPLVDRLSGNVKNNQGNYLDTLVTPWGAMNAAELGFEIGYNFRGAHFTLGAYNGYVSNLVNSDGTINTSSTAPTVAANAVSNTTPYDNGMRDFRFQYDQMLSWGAFTLGAYTGAIALSDPTSTFSWDNHYTQYRSYFTYYAVPSLLDLMAGVGWQENQFVSASTVPDGSFEAKGGFLGANYYVQPHLTLSLRGDKFYFNSNDTATGYSVQASLPYENLIWIFHYNSTASNLLSTGANLVSGMNQNVGLVLRFLL